MCVCVCVYVRMYVWVGVCLCVCVYVAEVTVDVTKCSTCHAKWRLRLMCSSATSATQRVAATMAANGNQARHQSQPGQCHKCHTCHAKWKAMSPSATPATQSDDQCHKCHTYHVKWRSMSPSATPATQSEGQCKTKVHVTVTKCHACHTKCRATTAANGNQARHQSQASAISATPATQSEGRCHQVPRLPHKVTVDVTKCHACHAKWQSMWPSATLATKSDGQACRGDHGGKREPSASPEPAQCHKCHACHAKWRLMSPSDTPATQSEGRCHQVPRLPHKVTVDVTKRQACHAN